MDGAGDVGDVEGVEKVELSLLARQRLSELERTRISVFFGQNEENGKLSWKKRIEAATQWNISTRTVTRLAGLQRKQQRLGLKVDLQTKVKGKKGRPSIEIDREQVLATPLPKRTTERSFVAAMGVSKSTMHRWIHEKQLRSHSNAIKPQISEVYQLKRVQFCVSHLKHNSFSKKTSFKDMHHIIHIDEKWFFMTRVAERYYLLPEEMEPHRTIQNKRYITKVMFLCAVSRPMYSEDGDLIFDGKIGIWPIVTKEAAKNKSKNRPAGTLITVPKKSVNQEVTKRYMLEKLVPAIKQKCPLLASTNILIQHDNARPHICDDDADFRKVARADGFDIRLGFQLPTSPDLNVLDLGFFRSIQSLQHQTTSKTIDDLISATEHAFFELNTRTLYSVFLTLQGCMVEIMKCGGSNRYKLPHMRKERLAKSGALPMDLEVDDALVRTCVAYLQQINVTSGLHRLIQDLQEGDIQPAYKCY